MPGAWGRSAAADAARTIRTHIGTERPIVGLILGSGLAGRFHMYEGHEAALAAFPVRVLQALGAATLFVSNAAGGIRRTFRPGDLMVIADHMNLTRRNPLFG